MRHFQKLRMDFITTHLNQTGAINRADLIDIFGISQPQASMDLNKWASLNPGAMVYNASRKRYERTAMTDHPTHHFQARPRLISPADFAELADLAWRSDPRRGLAKQISMAIGTAESTIDRWLKDDGYPPPPDVVRQALDLADKRMEAKADLIDRATDALK